MAATVTFTAQYSTASVLQTYPIIGPNLRIPLCPSMPSTLSYPGSSGIDWLTAVAVAVVAAAPDAALDAAVAAVVVVGCCESVSRWWGVEDGRGCGGSGKNDGDEDEEEEKSVLSDTRTRPAARIDSTNAGTIS